MANQANKTHTQIWGIDKPTLAAWLLMLFAMIFVLKVHLLPALLAGLLVFELVHIISPYIARHLPGKGAKIVAVAFLAPLLLGLVPSTEDIALTRQGKSAAPVGTPRRAADVPLPRSPGTNGTNGTTGTQDANAAPNASEAARAMAQAPRSAAAR